MDKYVFVSESDHNIYSYNPQPKTYNYYQVCMFANPKTGKYSIRKFVIDENEKFVNITETCYNAAQFKHFFTTVRENEIKRFAAWNFKEIPYPKVGDILLSQSDLLNNSCQTYGYANF
jgi:hypothetical protein